MPISEYYKYDRKIQKSQPGASFQRAVKLQRLFVCRVCVFISFGWRGLPCFPIFISPFPHTPSQLL